MSTITLTSTEGFKNSWHTIQTLDKTPCYITAIAAIILGITLFAIGGHVYAQNPGASGLSMLAFGGAAAGMGGIMLCVLPSLPQKKRQKD